MVSVIITVYNGELHLRNAIESVLRQTLPAWECVIVDDGSTDTTPVILAGLSDPRFHVIRRERIGRGRALNLACSSARAPYLAVLDADDEWLPDRLAKQVAFLESHPEVGIVGAGVFEVHECDGEVVYRVTRLYPRDHAAIARALARYTAFCHSAMMVRKSVWETVGGYDESLPCSLDYDFWTRAMRVTQAANLPEVLVVKRFHPEQRFRRDLPDEVRERVASRLRLRTAREHRLPVADQIIPLAYYLYARLPRRLKLAGLKATVARALKRLAERRN